MTKRTFSMFAVSFVVATGLFGARMLTSPPVTQAASNSGINVAQVEVPNNLPSFEDKYQLYTGVLDTLRR
ncbi:MAG: hypothetical protein ABW003_04545 [Microvirga sp.]|jgi:hypothetical protein